MFSRAERHKFPDWKGSRSLQQNKFTRLTPMHSTCFLNTPSIKGSSQKLPGRGGKITSKWIRSPNGFELLSETSLITPTLKLYAQPHHFPSSRLSKTYLLCSFLKNFLQPKWGNKTRKRKRHRMEDANTLVQERVGKVLVPAKSWELTPLHTGPEDSQLPVRIGRKKVLGGLL